MDKLSLMFDAKQFAAAFGAARDASRDARSEQDVMMWLEGGVRLAGEGMAWGQGQMNYQGHNHLFRITSLSMRDAGAAGIYASGRVMGLRNISDFSGNYRASSAEGTMAGGGLATYLQNERGVVIQLVAMDVATGANRSVNGVRLRLKNV
jgi:hypothetical protein